MRRMSSARGSGRMKPLMFGEVSHLWPQLPPAMRVAAQKTEREHDDLARQAEAALDRLGDDPTSERAQLAFEQRLERLRGHRYLVQPLRMRALISPRPLPKGLLHGRLKGLQATRRGHHRTVQQCFEVAS